jgi:hypothetical protein
VTVRNLFGIKKYKINLVIRKIVLSLYCNQNIKTMSRYLIKRECWSENTYNGYEDSPYWKINLYGNEYGLTDNGKLWSISNLLITDHTKEEVQTIINECKLKITLQ